MNYKNNLPYFLLFLLWCTPRYYYTPDPQKDIKEWVKNFSRQQSFSYRYEIKTEATKIKATGECIIDFGEHIKGVWDYGDTVVPFEYIGIKGHQWSKKDGKWDMSVRGEESNIFVQIERVLEFDKYELILSDSGYTYRTNATMPFLAPLRWKEMFGYITISRSNYLPQLIWVGLSDSSVYWQVFINKYNLQKKIAPPYYEKKSYLLEIDSTVELDEAIKKIKSRLLLCNLKFIIKKSESSIIVQLPAIYNNKDISEILAPGLVNIYGVAEKKEEAQKVAYLYNNPAQTIYLTDWICNGEIVNDADIGFDRLLKPFVSIKFKKKIDFPSRIVVEIDSNFIVVSSIDNRKKMDKIIIYLDMHYNSLRLLTAYLKQPLFKINVQPLTKGFD